MSLLSIGADAKTVKGQKRGYLTGVLYMAPHTLSGRNLCPDASPGCIATCLNTAGRGVFSNVQTARINKTHRFTADRGGFMRELVKEITSLRRRAKREGFTPLVRLNGTSDLPWENVAVPEGEHPDEYHNLMYRFPDMQFYDYTKSYARMGKFLNGRMPSNYHLTFSRSECNDHMCAVILHTGGNVAVVFDTKRGEPLPKRWRGFPVIDGDIDDARPSDPQGAISRKRKGVVIGLRAKGKARRDTTGFVVSSAYPNGNAR